MSQARLTIVMYHYVRDLGSSRFPDIKGLSVTKFNRQVQFLLDSYSIVSVEDVIAAVNGKKELPANSALLTFDDGYVDHYENVYPVLLENNISGAFFPPVHSTVERELLDVNRIHIVLASTLDKEKIAAKLMHMVDSMGEEWGLKSAREYYDKHASPGRWDGPDVMFIKRMLQFVLPRKPRTLIAKALLEEFVGESETVLANEFYLTCEQLAEMVANGMHVGAHGSSHRWLSKISPEEQELEVQASVNLLDAIGMNREMRTFCYPFGDWDESLLNIMRKNNFQIGFTTVPAPVSFPVAEPLTLSRVNTNDLPQ